MKRRVLVVLLILGVVIVGMSFPAFGKKLFNNVTITAFCDAGHNALPFQWYQKDFEKVGIHVKLATAPFANVYEKLKSEFIAQTGAYDLIVFFPMYLGEFAGMGYIKPLDQYAKIWNPNMKDVAKGFRLLYDYYGGHLYTLPYDGDVLSLYYRKDLFNNPEEKAAFKKKYGKELKPPQTWDDVELLAKFFTRKKGQKLAGKVLKSDFYGYAFLAQRGSFAYAWWLAEFASKGGVYFDENMRPMINTEAGVESLKRVIRLMKYSPPDVLSYGYPELLHALIGGRIAMCLQWPCNWKKGNDPTQSKVVGKLGIMHVPGVIRNGKLVYRAPMPCGRVLAVSSYSRHPKAAYWVARYLSVVKGLADVSTPKTGLDPYAYSQFNDPKAFAEFAPVKEAKEYLAALKQNLDHGFPDLNIPGSAEYIDTLEVYLGKAYDGKMQPKEALDAAARKWEATTKRLGKKRQIRIYRDMLKSWKELGLWK